MPSKADIPTNRCCAVTPLEKAGKGVVTPPNRSRKQPRHYGHHLYRARHLIENFFSKLK